jgi:hypothetical protein
MNIKITIDNQEVSLPKELVNRISDEVQRISIEVNQIASRLKQKKGLWRPKQEEEYWEITRRGIVDNFSNCNQNLTDTAFACGNCFQTRELAQAELDKRKALVVIKDYIAREFGEGEGTNEIYWDNHSKRLCSVTSGNVVWSNAIPMLQTHEQALQLIKACEKEIKTVLGVK